MALDTLVAEYVARRDGVRELGERIRQGGRETVIAFVDLAGSTEMKQRTDPATWLGYVQRFVSEIEARLGAGTLVKRIGDEVMLTFPDVTSCERFMDEVQASDLPREFPTRIGIDYGECYHLQFAAGLPDDPYGPPVDRCARIVARAQPGAILCSEQFAARSATGDRYLELGRYYLKGFPEPERIFLYRGGLDLGASYLAPLLEVLNRSELQTTGYRWATRSFTHADFKLDTRRSVGRPFLLRELLRLPKLPLSPSDVLQRIAQSHLPQPDAEFVGYLVEWDGWLENIDRLSSSTSNDSYTAFVRMPGEEPFPPRAALTLPPEMYEVVKTLPKGQHINLRGVVTGISLGVFRLDYVDIMTA